MKKLIALAAAALGAAWFANRRKAAHQDGAWAAHSDEV